MKGSQENTPVGRESRGMRLGFSL